MSAAAHLTWLRGAIAMMALAVVQRGAGLITMTFIARALDTKGLGAFAFTQSTSQTFYGFARVGADAGMHGSLAALDPIKNKSQVEHLLGQGCSVFLSIATLVAVAMMLLAETLANRLFGAAELRPYVYAAAALFAGQTMGQYVYIAFAGLNAFAAYSRITIVTSVVTTGLVVAGALYGGAPAAAWALVAAQGVAVALLAFALARQLNGLGLRFRIRWPARAASSMVRLGFPFYAGGLLLIPVDFANLALLSRSIGVEALGDLRVTQALLSVAAALPTAIAGPTITFLTARHAAGDGAGALLLQLKAIWILALGVGIWLAAIWPNAIDIVFGSGFDTARSVGVLSIVGFVPSMLLAVLQGGLIARQKTSFLIWIGAGHALVLGAFGWLLIKDYGLAGFFVAQGVATATGVLLSYSALRHGDPALRLTEWSGWLMLTTIIVVILIVIQVAIKPNTITGILTAVLTTLIFGLGVLKLVLSATERLAATTFTKAAVHQVLAFWPFSSPR